MSVVGPRPHPPGVKAGARIYEDVVQNFADRYVVKPGITGLGASERIARQHIHRGPIWLSALTRDIQYIRNWSPELELLIIVKTIFGGFGGRNAF